eukprot:CAMPEP_0194311878 /NCGR_PEP_ID=MMETSP0171-20130528/8801_1 /TAXON_ID=218684 /ORGANISM="Corethron pennatum, Strain L29A3" /LENGTH=99 /DNA_ID=CAMNT_0039066147 /DNA_START=629 /DNA_END=928 /DNA_ORIENTATION=+
MFQPRLLVKFCAVQEHDLDTSDGFIVVVSRRYAADEWDFLRAVHARRTTGCQVLADSHGSFFHQDRELISSDKGSKRPRYQQEGAQDRDYGDTVPMPTD